MKVQIIVNVDNEAHDNIDEAATEVCEILARYLDKMRDGSIKMYIENDQTMFNQNGNRAGQVIVFPYRN